jgi:hypothetical protein
MPIHQMRHIPLLDAEQGGNFQLLELSAGKQFKDVESQLCQSKKLVGLLKPEIGEDVAGASSYSMSWCQLLLMFR